MDASTQLLLDEVRRAMHHTKALGDAALGQLREEDWHRKVGGEDNTVAIIVRHMHGNMVSRWTDFLNSDGEKPDRNRDAEFETSLETGAELRRLWEDGWQIVFDAIDPLTPEHLRAEVLIRSQPHTVARALLRQVTHYAEHVGQIVLLAKHFRGDDWQTLSIPKRRESSSGTDSP